MNRALMLLIVLAMLATVGVPAAVATPGRATPDRGAPDLRPFVEMDLVFDVRNVNRTPIACVPDGRDYQVRASLVAPQRVLSQRNPPVTLYIPGGMGTVATHWRQAAADGAYDFLVRMAERGHASVGLDRIGFGASDLPDGVDICVGSDVDIIGQVIDQLRAGTYTVERRSPGHGGPVGGEPVAFTTVVIAGQSGGGLFSSMVAYSTKNVDGVIMITSAVDQGLPPDLVAQTGANTLRHCPQGDPDAKAAPGYTYVFDFDPALAVDVDPEVEAAFVAGAEGEGCGTIATLGNALAANRIHIPEIDVPVFHLGAENDYIFPPSAIEAQAAMFTGSPDNTIHITPNSGHISLIERGLHDGVPAAERVWNATSDWLDSRGFSIKTGHGGGMLLAG